VTARAQGGGRLRPPVPLSLDRSPEIERLQVERWRRMSPAEKAALVSGLTVFFPPAVQFRSLLRRQLQFRLAEPMTRLSHKAIASSARSPADSFNSSETEGATDEPAASVAPLVILSWSLQKAIGRGRELFGRRGCGRAWSGRGSIAARRVPYFPPARPHWFR
jgi:hypothetical protein